MLCPNCGSDNPSSRAACAVCGADLRATDVETLEPLQVNERDAFEDSLWPPAAVFVFEEDEENVLDIPTPLAQFEDAQADDVFEQSLSGVKLEDLIEDDEETEAESVKDNIATTPEPEPEPVIPPASLEPEPAVDEMQREEIVDNPAVEIVSAESIAPAPQVSMPAAPSMFQVVERQTLTPEPIVETNPPDVIEHVSEARKSKGRTALWLLSGLFAAAVMFGAGAAAGVWYAAKGTPRNETVAEPPPVETVAATPAAPAGMVYVPGGDYLMGSDEGDELSRPAHFISVRPFFIDRTEVTNQAYREFIDATGYDSPPTWKDGALQPGDEEMPVTGVTWYDAAAYAAWAGKRLPTEAEWEFAARGTEGRKYPWGNDWEPGSANVDNTSNALRRVGEGRSNPLGIFDLAGNAWEWTASDARSYPGGKEFPQSRLRLKIIRGGNFKSNSESSSSIFRGYYGASGEKDYGSTSFRCVKDIPK